jgi:hypothetical protein
MFGLIMYFLSKLVLPKQGGLFNRLTASTDGTHVRKVSASLRSQRLVIQHTATYYTDLSALNHNVKM